MSSLDMSTGYVKYVYKMTIINTFFQPRSLKLSRTVFSLL